jgi:hypothetical protein
MGVKRGMLLRESNKNYEYSIKLFRETSGRMEQVSNLVRGCIQKFPDWPPEARTANGTALCH